MNLFWLSWFMVLALFSVLRVSLTDTQACSGIHEGDEATLFCFKNTLKNQGGDALSSWVNGNVSSWRGIEWSSHNRVLQINLSYAGLSGQLWPFWCRLQALQSLDLSGNNLSGHLSFDEDGLCRGSKLHTIILRNNILSGSIPSRISIMKHLEHIDFGFNNLTGHIPTDVGHLVKLQMLLLNNNMLSSEVPDMLSNCGQLEHLVLNHNNLSGGIPRGLQQLRKLVVLELGYNNFSERPEFSEHAFPSLRYLSLFANRMSGTIPKSIAYMMGLQVLNLGGNIFSGRIPDMFGNLTQLLKLNLGFNINLTGEIPPSIGSCRKLQILDLSYNKLTGGIPDIIFSFKHLHRLYLDGNHFTGNLSSLRSITLDSNSFSGNLPYSIGNLTNLRMLSLTFNNFEGSLPWSIGSLARLKFLDLGGNQFTGSLPSTMEKMVSLRYLSMMDNGFTGHIPPWLGNLSSLRHISLRENNFTGTIPSELKNLKSFKTDPTSHMLDKDPDTDSQLITLAFPDGKTLEYSLNAFPLVLQISGNRHLSGSIPRELGELKYLQLLYLDGNNLSGVIPPSLANATQLILLGFNDNQLTGSIPGQLGSLSFLTHFNVSNNNLSGPIPAAGQFWTLDALDFAGNPELCGRPLNTTCKLVAPIATNVDKHSSLSSYGLALGVGAAIGFTGGLWGVVFLVPDIYIIRLYNFYKGY